MVQAVSVSILNLCLSRLRTAQRSAWVSLCGVYGVSFVVVAPRMRISAVIQRTHVKDVLVAFPGEFTPSDPVPMLNQPSCTAGT